MQIRRVKMRDVKEVWERIYASNHNLTPYSSYAFNRIVCRHYKFSPKRIWFRTKIFEVLDDNNDTVMIVPLYGNGQSYYLIGDLMMTGHLDFIYRHDTGHKEFAQALALLQNELKGAKLILNKISEHSRLNDYLASNYPNADNKTCVNIHFGTDFEAYVKSLSKNMRRHIRNMYNRLSRSELNWEIEIIMNAPVDSKTKNEMLRIYNNRASDRYGKERGLLIRLGHRYINPITISTARMKGNFNSILRIDGEIAAFSSGYVTNDGKRVILPRGAMNGDYASFSPGLLLDLETIKWLIHNSCVTDLDLSRGDEEYKYNLGGQEHCNYFYSFDFSELPAVGFE